MQSKKLSLLGVCASFFLFAGIGERGERDFSFRDIPRPYSAKDLAEERQQAAKEPQAPPSRLPEQQAGQMAGAAAGDVITNRARSGNEVRMSDSPLHAGGEFSFGPAPNSVSNVPGTTSASPNGTSNFFGTGGRPIPIEEESLNESRRFP